VDRVPGHARAPVHHPSTEAMTALCWDRVLNRRIATVKAAAQVKAIKMLCMLHAILNFQIMRAIMSKGRCGNSIDPGLSSLNSQAGVVAP